MSTYRASVRVEGDVLHVQRSLTAPDVLESIVTDATYAVLHSDGQVLGIGLEVEVAGESDTPVGDSITVDQAQPLEPVVASAEQDDEPADDEPTVAP